jgi:hypothetical protein
MREYERERKKRERGWGGERGKERRDRGHPGFFGLLHTQMDLRASLKQEGKRVMEGRYRRTNS